MPDLNLKHPFIDQVLDPIGVIIGLLLAIPILWTWYDLIFGRKKKHNKWLAAAKTTTGVLPAILVVDLTKNGMRAAVEHFRSNHENLKSIPNDRIVIIEHHEDVAPSYCSEVARKIQEAVSTISKQGADELHLFIGGPIFAAAMLGAELSNINCKVLVYQNDRSSNGYVNFGPLRHPRF